MNKSPKVSIGLPVFNGEPYLAAAIESVLAQTFTDFELVISDNASTDATAAICQKYAAQDQRIRYYRSAQNLGAAWNFNHVFIMAAGTYFKWIAADDVISPEFLAACVAILDEDPTVVISYPKTSIIDANGDIIDQYDLKLATDSPDPRVRFHDLLIGHKCFEVFGLIRSAALRQTPIMGNYGHADGVLLSRLSLMGRFQEIPAFLFQARKHAQQSMNVYNVYTSHHPNYHAYTAWFDPKKAERIILPTWRITFEYLDAIYKSAVTWREKMACVVYVGQWAWRKKRPLLYDLIIAARGIITRLVPTRGKP